MTADHLSRLIALTARPNWDDDGGLAIPPEEWQRAKAFAARFASLPWLSPCGDGSTHLRWSRDRDWIEVEQIGGVYAWTTSSGEVCEDKSEEEAVAAVTAWAAS